MDLLKLFYLLFSFQFHNFNENNWDIQEVFRDKGINRQSL